METNGAVMFSTTATEVRPNTGPKRPPPPPPPNAAPLAMNEADLFHRSATSWQRSPNGDWAACHGTSAPPSYTYALYSGPAPNPMPVAFAPARVAGAWQQAAEKAAERASMDRTSPGNGSRIRAVAHYAARSGVPESIQRAARAAEAAYRAYYAATRGGGGMHAGRAPLLLGPVSPPVKRRIKGPAPPTPPAPKACGPTDAGLRAALLPAVEQRCASQQEASVTLAADKKRKRVRPSDDDALKEHERVVVWNRVTGKKLTGKVAL